ncbi:MAG: hypothetical protein H6923_01570 [Alphaproteobacteria bacterium]|nr:hypothetical protein [Alphaproteobacteria bacterium]
MLRLALIGLGSAAGLGLVVVWHMSQIDKETSMLIGFAAKEICSCLYVEERTLEACRADLPAEARAIHLRVPKDEEAVEARVNWQVKRLARYSEGSGCTLE